MSLEFQKRAAQNDVRLAQANWVFNPNAYTLTALLLAQAALLALS